MQHYKSVEFVNFQNVKPPRKNAKPLLKLSSDDSESAACPSFVQKKPNLTQMKLEFNLRHKMTRYSKNLEVPRPTGPPGYTYIRGVYITSFLRCFRDQIRVPRIENRVPRIRENRVSRIREIGSLHVHTGQVTFSLKKP